jgi:hypothetical protein
MDLLGALPVVVAIALVTRPGSTVPRSPIQSAEIVTLTSRGGAK